MKRSEESAVIFLRSFTKEILINFYKEKYGDMEIVVPEIRVKSGGEKRFREDMLSKGDIAKEFMNFIKKKRRKVPREEILSDEEISKEFSRFIKRKSVFPRAQPRKRVIHSPVSAVSSPQEINPIISQPQQQLQNQQPIQTPIISEDVNIKKIEPLLINPNIQFIECQGPNKPLLIKSFGNTRRVRTTLNEGEIRGIIKEFSRVTRIPLIGGVFKALTKGYLITAIFSDHAGSRFIITKYNQV